MSDLDTPWISSEGIPGESEWFDSGPFAQGAEALTEQPLPEQPWVAEADVATALDRGGEQVPESPFETPVEGFGGTLTAAWGDAAATVAAEAETEVAGCGGPLSGSPPLIYRTSRTDRSRNPWVGKAQTLLNVFLAQQKAGTEKCVDQTTATRHFIVTMRPKLLAIGQDPLGTDCIFGEGTEIATLMFQACRGLLRDGKIGEKTWPDLLALDTVAPVPTPTPTPSPTPTPTPSPVPSVRVREDVWTLSAGNPWHPTLLWYARGVAALRARDGDLADPRSWIHLASLHGAFGQPSSWPTGSRWNQCEHESWFFLPWHRVYLHHFERILHSEIMRLGGPGDWALPYWDYSDTTRPEVLRLPPAFTARTMPDGSANPLRVEERRPGLNDGDPIVTDVSTAGMFAQRTFEPRAGVGGGFGGKVAPLGTHNPGPTTEPGALEIVPHGAVHVAVGGDGPSPGHMFSFERSGLDPIFWLHHANVDRLWDAWLRHRRTNRNPQKRAWLDGAWTMGSGSDETVLSSRQVLDPRRLPLGYRYSDMPLTPTRELEDEWMGEEQLDDGQIGEDHPAELVGATEGETPLGAQPTTARVKLNRPSGPSSRRLAEGEAVPKNTTVYLRLENVTATVVHTSAVVVYVNMPPGGRPADFPDRRAGTLAMFGVVESSRRDASHGGSGRTVTFDITRAARSLASARQWDPTKIDVTFVPIPDARGRVSQGDVKVGRVSVFYA